MKRIMDDKDSKKIFSYDKDINFEEFSDYFKTFSKKLSKKWFLPFTIIYLFLAVLVFMFKKTSTSDFFLVIFIYFVIIFIIKIVKILNNENLAKKIYNKSIKSLKNKNNILDFYEGYLIVNMCNGAKKIYYMYLKKIIENDKYFYLIDDTRLRVWLIKEILNDA